MCELEIGDSWVGADRDLADKKEKYHIIYEGAGICMRETVDSNCPGLVSVSLNNCGAVSHYKWMN